VNRLRRLLTHRYKERALKDATSGGHRLQCEIPTG
jgi:hypothetical protein